MAENIIGSIIGIICCLLCACPFLIISKYDKNSATPIAFWAGDNSLKQKIDKVSDYNKEMASLYKLCAFAFIICGVGCLINLLFGIVLLLLCCTIGFYLVYKKYKSILNKYLKEA